MFELLESNPKLLITVVGIGGCGCNTISILNEAEFSNNVNLIAVNTDLAVLDHMDVSNKILIGEELTKGYGAGADPAIGLKAAQESEEALTEAIKNSAIVIITAGFGGGTGTGASPVVARIARELDISCLAVVTLPFESECKMRMDYALAGLEEIKNYAQAHISLSNDLLLKGLGKNIGLFSAFNQSNSVLKNLVSSLVQMLTKTGLISVDINDFSRILSFEGESVLGVGKAECEEQALEALDQALNNPLVSSANIESAKAVIIQICCNKEITLGTYEGLVSQLKSKLHDGSALVIAGVTFLPELSCEIEILLIASGISDFSSHPILEETLTENEPEDDYLNVPAFLRNQSKQKSVLLNGRFNVKVHNH